MLTFLVIAIVLGLVPDSLGHDRPVIGVLVQEISTVFELMYPNQFDSFVPASYVKWIEAGGARVVPVWTGKDRKYYKSIMSKINGVVLPGGYINKTRQGGYAEASEIIVNHAIGLNMRQDFFPIFGIGLGMETLIYLSNDKKDVSVDCGLETLAAPLILTKHGRRLIYSC